MFKRVRLVALAVLALMAFSTVAAAGQGGGLGSNWPNATDVSRNSSFHAYRFDMGGVSFIQVNSSDGTPRMAVAAGNGAVVVLPIGDAASVVVDPPATLTGDSSAVVVYTDGGVTIQATSVGYNVVPAAAATCNDPVECTRPDNVTSPTTSTATTTTTTNATTLQALSTCNDPVECSRVN